MHADLFHFSEESGIAKFEPRPPLEHPDQPAAVWAVDAEHAWTYLFPRDCPRILLWPIASTTMQDRERWLGQADSGRVACIEWSWLERLRSTTLYRYRMPAEAFQALESEDVAWMFTSRDVLTPLAIERLHDLESALRDAGVELRLMPSLTPLRKAWASTMHVSGIRLRNAEGWDV